MADEGNTGAAAPSGDSGAAEAPAAAPAEAFEAAAAVPATPTEAAAPAEAAPAAEEIDLETPAADDVWSDPVKAKAYGEKLRKEAAANRVKAREAAKEDDTFSNWSESDAKVLKQTIQLAAADPKVGAAKMREIAALLDGGDVEGAAAVAAEASEAAGEEHKALTEADVEAKVNAALEAADKQKQIEAKRDEIISQAKEWGYEPGTPDYFTLLHIAQFDHDGDLSKAHETIEARNQAVIDKYVADVRTRAAGAPIHAGTSDDSVIDPSDDNKTWESARKRTEQRLINLRKR